jgi:hypothetical protein
MTEIKILQERLEEAELAYHMLVTGAKEVSVSISDYGSVTYNQSSSSKLEKYIYRLKIAIHRKTSGVKRKAIFVEF